MKWPWQRREEPAVERTAPAVLAAQSRLQRARAITPAVDRAVERVIAEIPAEEFVERMARAFGRGATGRMDH